jgi:hypothetical protein
MSIGTQKHTPELIDQWLQGDGWDWPQDDSWASSIQGWRVKTVYGRAPDRRLSIQVEHVYDNKGRYKALFPSDKEALDWVVSRAISGNALAIKALCYLSHHNPSEYGHWGKLLKGMYGKEKL